MKKYSFISTIVFAALLLAFLACNNKKANPETKETEIIPDDIVEMREDQIKLANIQTGLVEWRSLSGTFKVSGVVATAPQNLAIVCFPFGGYIKSTSLIPGNIVKKGQPLAILQNQDFIDIQQNFLEAKNKLEYAEGEYNRHNELYKDDVYSQKNVQAVTADYKSLKVQVTALEQKLSLIGIDPENLREDNISSSVAVVSPISGYIKTANVNLGKYVAPSDVLFEIINTDKLFLELTLYEKDAAKISNGQKIHFFVNNENEQHEALVYQTGKSIDSDKTYKVYASVISSCKSVLPGMFVSATIEASGNKAMALPSEAIVSFDDKDYIFVFEKNKIESGKPFTEYRMIQVKKGIVDNGYTEVILPEKFDIKSGKVVIKGAYNLLSAKKNAGEMAC